MKTRTSDSTMQLSLFEIGEVQSTHDQSDSYLLAETEKGHWHPVVAVADTLYTVQTDKGQFQLVRNHILHLKEVVAAEYKSLFETRIQEEQEYAKKRKVELGEWFLRCPKCNTDFTVFHEFREHLSINRFRNACIH